jgi:hypothetical protein
VTRRDRELIAMLVIGRYLSTEQVGRLFFPGRHPETIRKRLVALTRAPGDYLRRLHYRTFEGEIVTVWTPSLKGYLIAQEVLGRGIAVPRTDVSAAFLEHSVALNDLLVGLISPAVDRRLAAEQVAAARASDPIRAFNRGKEHVFASTGALPFTWLTTESARLPWSQYDVSAGRMRERLICPDAILELRSAGRRLFVECEMGGHTIAAASDDKAGATLHKAERYEEFVFGLADPRARQTFYARQFPDALSPEVLFLVRSEGRARSVNRALDTWRRGRAGGALQARALTLEESLAELLSLVGDRPAPEPSASLPPPAAPKAPPALTRAEVSALRSFYRESVGTLKAVRAAARGRREPPPEYPTSTPLVLDLLRRLAGEHAS